MIYKEIDGCLISLAKQGKFDVITHCVNCFCTQKSGIAAQMSIEFKTDNNLNFRLEHSNYRGDINKLGQIEYCENKFLNHHTPFPDLIVVNSYAQYRYGTDKRHLDYEALTLCMRKINHIFKGKVIGLPKIGAGRAGGWWPKIEQIVLTELKDVKEVIIVNYKKE